MSRQNKYLSTILILIIMMLGLAVGVYLVQKNLEIREKAAELKLKK